MVDLVVVLLVHSGCGDGIYHSCFIAIVLGIIGVCMWVCASMYAHVSVHVYGWRFEKNIRITKMYFKCSVLCVCVCAVTLFNARAYIIVVYSLVFFFFILFVLVSIFTFLCFFEIILFLIIGAAVTGCYFCFQEEVNP